MSYFQTRSSRPKCTAKPSPLCPNDLHGLSTPVWTSSSVSLRSGAKARAKQSERMMASISSSREWLSVPLQRSQPESSRDRPTLVSLNRFEAKKNIKLALTAFKKLETDALIDREVFRSLRLVIAGESYMAGGLS